MPVEIKRNGSSSQRSKKKDTELINMQLDIETLTTMCKFVISDSIYVKRYDLTQLRRFLEIIDTNKIARISPDVNERLNFIRFGLEAKLDKKLNGRDSVLSYINQRFTDDIKINLDSPIGKEDIEWINTFTAETLKYEFIYQDIENLRNLCNEFSLTTIGHRGDIVSKFESHIDMMKNQFRTLRAQDASESIFSLQGERFENQITDTFNKVKSPSRRLYTGMQGFNQITGGIESGRVYMLFGTTGVGKSVTLLNLMFQLKKYNKFYVPKDPTKVPCIVMLTMENTITETITRLFDLVTNDGHTMDMYGSVEEVMNRLKQTGELVVNDESPIDLVIKYKPNHSCTTDYLYTLYDELEDEGFEPICLIQDHVKRIRAVDSDKDLRLELGNIVNEFKVFASLKDIPVISDSHLNREAARIIDNGANKSKSDITRMLGKENVGESLVMLDNLDMGIIINKEYDRDGNIWLAFNVIKSRIKNERDYIVHPFEQGSSIKLVEDVGLPVPAFKETLRSMGNLVSPYGNFMQSNIGTINPSSMFTSDESNIFNKGTSYSAKSNNVERDIPQIDIDNTPLTSDIPGYEEPIFDEEPGFMVPNPNAIVNIPSHPKVDPFIWYETKEDVNAKGVIDEIAKMLS